MPARWLRVIETGANMAISNSVVDLSHHNQAVNFGKAKADGIIGVIHKASQGQSYRDPTYKARRKRAADAGILWGAYHFGTGSNGIAQAENFLQSVGDPAGVMMVLDFESILGGPCMTLEVEREFLSLVYDQTGKWPGLYAGHYLKELLGTGTDTILAKSWFWLAQYGPTAVVPPNWDTWTMWQYTDGAVGPGPYKVAGIGRCDRDYFNGTDNNLRTFWGQHSP